jgi:hypothetical protein
MFFQMNFGPALNQRNQLWIHAFVLVWDIQRYDSRQTRMIPERPNNPGLVFPLHQRSGSGTLSNRCPTGRSLISAVPEAGC